MKQRFHFFASAFATSTLPLLVSSAYAQTAPAPDTPPITIQAFPPSTHFTYGPTFKLPSLEFSAKPSEGTSTFTLGSVQDKAGQYFLTATNVELRALLTILAGKGGGKALFDNRIPAYWFTSANLYQGTPDELIRAIANRLDLLVGRVGTDWVLVPQEKPQMPPVSTPDLKHLPTIEQYYFPPSQLTPDLKSIPGLGQYFIIPPSTPTPPSVAPGYKFNLNPAPGKNLPDNAKPFEFNGNRLYHVPLT